MQSRLVLLLITMANTKNLLKREAAPDNPPSHDAEGRYNGGSSPDCTESVFLTPFNTMVQIETDPDVIKEKVKCRWDVISSDTCKPHLTCTKFTLSATPGCEDSLEVADGVGGYEKFCGSKGPVDLTTKHRDLFITFNSNGGGGRGLQCSVKCVNAGTPGLRQLEEATEPDVNEECTCGRKPPGNRIVGGQDSKKGEFPWIVAFVTANTRKPYCGGTIINNKYILTAAHCFKGVYQDVRNFDILANSHLLDVTGGNASIDVAKDDAADGTVRLRPESFAIHPLYVRQTNDFDVALVKLTQPIDFKKHVSLQPACIPHMINSDHTNSTAVVAGWGLSHVNSTVTMATLQKLNVVVFSQDGCKVFYNERITRRMMCAGFEVGGKDSCKGDSGGPLVKEKSPQVWELIGIVSWGEGCAGNRTPGVYVKVAEVSQWVRYVANSEGAAWCRGWTALAVS